MISLIATLTIAMLSFSNLVANPLSDFDSEVRKTYDEYQETAGEPEFYKEYPEYTIKVVRGIMNNEVRYGLYFSSDNPGTYYADIRIGDQLYSLPKTARGDIIAVALDLKSNDVFSIAVFFKDGKPISLPQNSPFLNIRIVTADEFRALDSVVAGEGLGTELTKLETGIGFDWMIFLYIAFACITVSCIFVLIIFYRKHLGMFNDDVKSQNVFNFREFLNSTFEEEPQTYPEATVSAQNHEENADEPQGNMTSESERVHQVYHSWSRDDDDTSGFDIGNYLKSRGLSADYSTAKEEEKNLIMLELMKLRDSHTITQDDYYQEVGSLWKN
jgi:hypothetical protein